MTSAWGKLRELGFEGAVPDTFGVNVDFAVLIKVYRAVADGERRYSPAEVASVETVLVAGQPDPERICTSIVERSNLSLRMGTRRCTRLTNAFSKKWENHWAAMSLWYTFYNFCRIHKALRVTPAMAAGITAGLGRAGTSGCVKWRNFDTLELFF